MKCRPYLKLGHVGLKTSLVGQILEKVIIYTLDGTMLIQFTYSFVRFFISMKYRSYLKLGHIGSKIRSLG